MPKFCSVSLYDYPFPRYNMYKVTLQSEYSDIVPYDFITIHFNKYSEHGEKYIELTSSPGIHYRYKLSRKVNPM